MENKAENITEMTGELADVKVEVSGDKTENLSEQKADKPTKKVKLPKKPKAAKQPKAKKEKAAFKLPKLDALKQKRMNKSGQAKAVKPEKPMKKPSKFMIFSIRNKIFVCFLVPILFMVVVGITSYQKAAEGMNEKYQESTKQTIDMATDYIDVSYTFIESEGLKYAFDTELSKYYLGMFESNPIDKLNLVTNIKSELMSTQTANPFISNMFIITKSGVDMFSTKSGSSNKGIFEDYRAAMSVDGRKLEHWVDNHQILDDYLKIDKSEYIMSYQILSQSNNAAIVIDIDGKAIETFLADIDLGAGSIIGYVTPSGRELIVENLAEGQTSTLTEGEAAFYGQEFFDAITEENMSGTRNVEFKGEEYLFIYSRSENSKATICALVPIAVVTGQAESIKALTVSMVIMACVTAVIIGIIIAAGIQANMRRISRRLGDVAKGDLTVEVRVKTHDEFRNLAFSANNMIVNTKKLVSKVSGATQQLEVSAKQVEEASGVISDYSEDITQAINDINEGMSKQSEHAQECVLITDSLSNEMQEVSRVVESVEKLVDETEKMISRGMDIVTVLGDRAKETTSITSKVGSSIEALKQESVIINKFVETITDISEQTNLLSLNASIEAARAGDAGRGFAVVAEEIRKLADDSAKAAGEISNNVANISAQTIRSVDSAKQAEEMVALQTEAVEEVVDVFREMNQRMTALVAGLKDIVTSTERADKESGETLEAVRNISEIIEETANSAEVVRDVATKLMKNVENLNETANSLSVNMGELKTEIAVFKTE